MKGIGGNITGIIQTYTVTKNEIGEQEKEWVDKQSLKGWLDLQTGNSNYTTYNAKLQESTHIFHEASDTKVGGRAFSGDWVMGRKHNLIRDSQNDENERKERKTELNLEANISEKGKTHEIN